MDHQVIENDNLVERYLLGELTVKENRLFEQHYFECDQCFQAIRRTEKSIHAIKEAARRGVLAPAQTTVVDDGIGLLERLKALFSSPMISYASAVLVFALIYPAGQWLFRAPKMETELERLRQPQFNAAVYSLQGTTRAASAGQNKLVLKPADETFVLTFTLPAEIPLDKRLQADLLNEAGEIIWQADNLKSAGPFQVFSITCRTSFFKKGGYTLRVYDSSALSSQSLNHYLFPFDVVIE